jgi:O-acetylserine/cysteine efflux transporter
MSTQRPVSGGDFTALMGIAIVWGCNNLFAKMVVDALPPLFAAGMRFLLLAIVMAPLLRAPPKAWAGLAGVVLLIGPIHFGVQNIGLSMADDLAPMVIAMQLWAPASVAFAALFLGERLKPLRLAGIGLSFLGVAAMAFSPSVAAQLPALIVTGLAALAYAAGAVGMRKFTGLDPWQTQAWIAMASFPLLLGASALVERGHEAAIAAAGLEVWAMIAFGALVSSLLANVMMFKLLKRYEVSQTTPYLLLAPVIGISLGVLVLHDAVNAAFFAGGAMALGGVALVALADRRRS